MSGPEDGTGSPSGGGAGAPASLPDDAALQQALGEVMSLPPDQREAAIWDRWSAQPEVLRALLASVEQRQPTRPHAAEPPTAAPGRAPDRPATTAGRIVGRRWRLGRVIGEGGQGVVCEAGDTVFGGTAAVKLVRGLGTADQVRIGHEVAALRWLHLPGVVRFLDSGADDGDFWIATEIVSGAPFPGAGAVRDGPVAARTWRDLESLAFGLLEAVGRVHGKGVVHGDLKPSNVLVDGAGRVTLLDLGLASSLGVGIGDRTESPGGTPGFAAPELHGGGPASIRSDVYACGVLLLDALCARHPAAGGTWDLSALAAPDRVRDALRRMVDPDAVRRTASTGDAARELRQERADLRRSPWTERELRTRFGGFDRFMHLREDAARELHRRTGGDPAAVENELAAWIRSGLAHLEEGLVHIDRVAIERLVHVPPVASDRPPPPPASRLDADSAEFASALRMGDAAQAIRLGMALASRSLHVGRVAMALGTLEEVATAARVSGDVLSLRAALVLAADVATQSGEARAFERVRWIADRSPEAAPEAPALTTILSAVLRRARGEGDGGLSIVECRPEDAAPSVAITAWRVRVILSQSGGLDLMRKTVAAGQAWARRDGCPDSLHAAGGWRAQLLYREGRCRESVRIRERLLREEIRPGLRYSRLVLLGASESVAGDDRRAARHLRAALRVARRLRLADGEAHSWELLQEIRFRTGRPVRLAWRDIAAFQAAIDGRKRPVSSAQLAVIAWRTGRSELARRILGPRVPADTDLAYVAHAALAGAIDGTMTGADALAVADKAAVRAAPAVQAQVLALLAIACPPMRDEFARRFATLDLPRRGRHARRLREFMSIDEARDVLAGRPLPDRTPERGRPRAGTNRRRRGGGPGRIP